jgi:flagellar hook assembly protein FlgD
MKGSLVQHIAKGDYAAGHYEVSWNGEGMNGSAIGSGFYIIRMKAQNFDKRIKLIRMQ